MERKCKTCKFWRNQNKVIDNKYTLIGKHQDKEIGFCLKITDGLVIIPDKMHNIKTRGKGIVSIKIPFEETAIGLYTKEDFKCKFYKPL
jgi:hypothetical protein